jgi:hypothetical protein
LSGKAIKLASSEIGSLGIMKVGKAIGLEGQKDNYTTINHVEKRF